MSGEFIGPCAHGRDPYTRCEECGGRDSVNVELDALRAERDALTRQIAELDAERNRCCGDNEALRAASREAREALRGLFEEGTDGQLHTRNYRCIEEATAECLPDCAAARSALRAIDTALGEP